MAQQQQDGQSEQSSNANLRNDATQGAEAAHAIRKQAHIGESPIVEFFTRKFPIFAVLGSFEANQPTNLVIIGLFVCAMQQIGFVVNPHFGNAWGYILGEEVASYFYAFHLPLYDVMFYKDATYAGMHGTLWALVALSLALYGIILVYFFTRGDTDKQNAVFVYINRALVHSLSTWLLVPSLQVAFAGMICGGDDKVGHFKSTACWSADHAASFVGGVFYVVTVLPLMYLSIACQFDDTSRTDHLKGRAHSLVDDYVFIHNVLSCIVYQLTVANGYMGAFATIFSFSSAFVAAAHAYYLPYLSMRMNQFHCAVHSLASVAGALAAAGSINEPFRDSGAPSVLLLGLAPLISVIAICVSQLRVSPLFVQQMCEMKLERVIPSKVQDKSMSTQEVESASTVAFPSGLCDDSLFAPVRAVEEQVIESFSRASGHTDASSMSMSISNSKAIGGKAKRDEVVAPFVSAVHVPSDVSLAASFVTQFQRATHHQPTLPMLVFGAKIFSKGLVRFQANTFLVLRFAAFVVEFIPSMSSVGIELIEQLGHAPGSVVTRYRTKHVSDRLRHAMGIKNQAHLMQANAARKIHCDVLERMNAFWVKLTEPSVNIGQVSVIADEITERRKKALVQFRRALQHQTSSDAHLVNNMGDFLHDVMLDSEGATECYNEARELREARQARSMRGTKQHTAVVDVETLTNRLLQLLHSKKEAATSSSGVRNLMINVTAVFLALLTVAALFMFVASQQKTESILSLEKMWSAGSVRTDSARFVAVVYDADLANSTQFRDAISNSTMAAVATGFSEHFHKLTAGDAATRYDKHQDFYRLPLIPLYDPSSVEVDPRFGSHEPHPVSLWTLGERSLAAMQSLVSGSTRDETRTAVAAGLKRTLGPVSNALDLSMRMYRDEDETNADAVLTWSVTLFVIGLAIIVVIYLTFLTSLQRTALGRIFTFQLFTLIPFDALERLATETREKINILTEERQAAAAAQAASAKAANDAAHHVDEDGDPQPNLLGGTTGAAVDENSGHIQSPNNTSGEDSGVKIDGVDANGGHRDSYLGSSGTTHSKSSVGTRGNSVSSAFMQSISGQPPVVVSILKKVKPGPAAGVSENSSNTLDKSGLGSSTRSANARKNARKVRFNPKVAIIGPIDDGSPKLREREGERKTKASAGVGGEDDEEEDEALAEARKKAVKARRRKRDGDTRPQFLLIIAFAFITVMAILAMILAGLSIPKALLLPPMLEEVKTHQRLLASFSGSVDECDNLSLEAVSLGTSSTVRHYFDTSADSWHSINEELLNIGLSEEEAQVVTEIQFAFYSVLEVQRDAITLSLLARGQEDVRAFPQLRGRAHMSLTAYVAAMKSRYPDAWLAADALTGPEAGGNLTSLVAFALQMLGDEQKVEQQLLVKEKFEALQISKVGQEYDDAIAATKSSTEIAALVVCAIVFFLAAGLAVFPIEQLSNGHIGRGAVLLIGGLALIPLIILCVSIASHETVKDHIRNRQELVESLSATNSEIEYIIRRGHYFAATGHVSYWYEFDEGSKGASVRKLPSKLAGYLDSRSYVDVAGVISLFTLLQEEQKISNAMMMSYINGSIPIEPAMADTFSKMRWDLETDPDYRSVVSTYGSGSAYSNTANDLQLPRYRRWQLAMYIQFGLRFHDLEHQMSEYQTALFNHVSENLDAENSKDVNDMKSIMIVATACMVLPIGACLLVAARLAGFVVALLGLQAGSSAHSMDTTLYSQLIARCEYSLLFLAALLCATFGVGVWTQDLGKVPLHQLDLASSRNFIVAESLVHIRVALASTEASHTTLQQLRKDFELLQQANSQLYFGRDRGDGELYAVGQDPRLDTLLFGGQQEKAAEEVTTSMLRSSCGDLIEGAHQPLVNRGDFGDLNNPVQIALLYWMASLSEIAYMGSYSTLTDEQTTRLKLLERDLTALSLPLYHGLRNTTERIFERAKDTQRKAAMVFQGIIGGMIACIAIVYVTVFVPTATRLVEEEESARLLLRMIPVNVRDQVPAISEFIETGKIDNAAELQKKFEASERLLQNILPQKIAARLKSGEQPIADMHPSITILFTDFVGFTKRSSSMQAAEIVDFLNEVFLEFDTIVEFMELEKIKTIGDAYFMAGGLDPRISDHAMRVIEAAIRFFQSLKEHNERHPNRSPLQMRLGVHTGPAVAGVIGTKKVAYDLWGESVEIANAMESTGVPGKVHISEPTASHVKGYYRLVSRGPLPRDKETVPDNMPATFLIEGRRMPTPYQHIVMPRIYKARLGNLPATDSQSQPQQAAPAAASAPKAPGGEAPAAAAPETSANAAAAGGSGGGHAATSGGKPPSAPQSAPA